jgi:hypothetical protein
VALLGLAACFDPAPPLGAPCVGPSSCPDGQTCAGGFCLAGGASDAGPDDVPVTPVMDRDGDLVADQGDNCPDAQNADQGDEDTDQLGDVCDPCPIDPDNVDPDGDGVAGSCDPHPATAGDKLVAFTGFHRGVPADWQLDGTATQDGDSMALMPAVGNHTSIIAPIEVATSGTATIGVVVDAEVGTRGGSMTLAMPYDPSEDQGIFCELDVPPNGSNYMSLWDSIQQVERGSNDFAWSFGTAYRLALTRTNKTGYVCTASAGATTRTASSTVSTMLPQAKVSAGAYGTTAHVAWMLVVTSP